MGGDFEQIVQQVTQSEELQQLLASPTPTQPAEAIPTEAVPPAQEATATPAPAEEVAPAEATAPAEEMVPPLEALPTLAAGTASPDELAEDIMQSLLDQMEEGGDEPFTFGCEEATIPMPEDMVGCVSVAGFTTYSTAMEQAAIDKMYTDYFTGQGWKAFPEAIQGEVINAWRNNEQGMAMLSFMPQQGEDGKNLISVGVIAE